jgi:hypothetical protein
MSKAIKLVGTGRFQVLGLPAEKDAKALPPMTKKGTSPGMYSVATITPITNSADMQLDLILDKGGESGGSALRVPVSEQGNVLQKTN